MSAWEADQSCADILVGGFGGSAAGYAELLEEMRRATGRPTSYVGMSRWKLFFFRNPSPYPRALYRQALHLANVLDGRRIKHVRLYGHSMGGAIVTIFADVFGDRFEVERVVALNPAGVYIDGALPLLLRMIRKGASDARMLKHHANERVRRIIKTSKIGVVTYLLNPVRSLAEGLALSRTRVLVAAYPQLRKRGTPIAIIHSDDDIVFESARLLKALNDLPGIMAFELTCMPHDMQYFPAETVTALQRHGVL